MPRSFGSAISVKEPCWTPGVANDRDPKLASNFWRTPLISIVSSFSALAPIYGSAIGDIKKEGILRTRCRHRPVQCLNNIIEQDHRALKRRVSAKQGFREFQAARRTIHGYEAMNIIRKGQVRWLSGSGVRLQNRFMNVLFELGG
jgi:DDE superfamily endonuclease